MRRTYRVANLGLVLSRAERSMADYDKALSRFEELARLLPEGPRLVALRKVLECRELVREMRDLPEAFIFEAEAEVDKYLEDIKREIDKGIPVPQQSSGGIPTLAYVGAGAVAAGIAVLLLA